MNRTILISSILGIIVIGIVSYVFVWHRMPHRESQKLEVAASFYPLYFFASQIGGEKVAVLNVTPADAEPHDYEPTAQDIARIESSRVLILNGNLEPSEKHHRREHRSEAHGRLNCGPTTDDHSTCH